MYNSGMRNLVGILIVGTATACGSLPGNGVDAQDGSDAAPIDGEVDSTVHVTVLSTIGDGVPDVTAHAVFLAPDGTQLLDTVVDGGGKAQAPMPSGGSVLVLRRTGSATTYTGEVVYVRGVKAGDDLHFGRKLSPNHLFGGTTQMTANLTPPSATKVVIVTPCSNVNVDTATTIAVPLRDSCHGATFPMLTLANSTGTAVPQYVFQSAVTHQNAGTIQVPTTFVSMGNYTAMAQNTPAAIATLSFQRATLIGGRSAAKQVVDLVGDPAAGTVTAVTKFPSGIGDGFNSTLVLSEGSDGTQFVETHSVVAAPTLATQLIDLSTRVLPWIATTPVQTQTGLSWTESTDGGTATPDLRVVRWRGQWMDAGHPVTASWVIVEPGVGTASELPTLTGDSVEFDPHGRAGVILTGFTSVTYADYSNLDGYDAARSHGDALGVEFLSNVSEFPGESFERRLSMESNPL